MDFLQKFGVFAKKSFFSDFFVNFYHFFAFFRKKMIIKILQKTAKNAIFGQKTPFFGHFPASRAFKKWPKIPFFRPLKKGGDVL